MNPDNLPKPEEEPYNPNLDAQDEELTAGSSNRLLYGLVAVLLVLVLGYLALPKGNGGVIAAATPSFMLDDAAVTATVAKPAVTAPADPKVDADTEGKSLKNPKLSTRSVADAAPAKAAPTAVAPTAAVAPAPVAAPEPVQAAPVAPEPATPASVTLSGKIDDENGRPLVGATVFLKGSRKGTSTDANGHYTIEVPAGSDNTLVYGYGGYDDEVVRSRNSEPINVTLTPREKASKKRR